MLKNRRFLTFALIAVLLLVFGTVYSAWYHGPEFTSAVAAELDMKPTSCDSAGVDLDTRFIIKSKSPLNPNLIRENLIVEPSMDFSVKKADKDGEEIILEPKKPLEPQMIYKFTLAAKDSPPVKWAFQTKGIFTIVSTLPRDASSGVPVDTGIEITFSHLNFDKLPNHFDITPKVEGSFEVHKKTAVFVPKKLEPATVYTVTIKKGLPLSGSSQQLDDDYVFQFETREKDNHPQLSFYKDIQEFTTKEKPLFQLGYFGIDKKNRLQGQVTLYKYKSAEDYINALENKEKTPFWAYCTRQNYSEDVSGLEQAAKFSVPLREYQNTTFMEFPEPMPPGYYVAEAAVQDVRRQVWFQVTDLSAFTAVDGEKVLVWVNDLANGSPVEGASVSLAGSKQTDVTADNGLAQISAPKERTLRIYLIISKDDREAVAPVIPKYYAEPEWDEQQQFNQTYWKYLYLDRSLYKPGDTVYFWGLVKPRKPEVKSFKDVTVALSSWRSSADIQNKEIELDDFTFTGNMKLPKLSPGYYYLTIKSEDKIIVSKGFDVQTYSKPAYQIEITPSKKAVFAGERIDFQVKTAFFEGTPAANIPLKYHIDDTNGELTTDTQGEISFTHTTRYEDRRYPIQFKNLYLSANQPESGEISCDTRITVLNNDIAINASGKAKDGTGRVEIELSKLTADKVNSGKADPWDIDAFKEGPAANRPIIAKVYREVWEKRDIGQYYDFINKKVQTRYEYEYKKVFLRNERVTSDSEGKALLSFPVKKGESYLVELTSQDYRGNGAFQEVRVVNPDFYREYTYQWYHLEDEKPSGKHSVGETVNLSMKKNETFLSPRQNGFMFLLARENILGAEVRNSGNFSTVFNQNYVPNFWAKGVYFDGRFYHETYEQLVTFDQTEKSLNIKIKTDKSEYRPKDKVHVEVEITDKNGRPVEAKVNLNLVDEALYAIQDQYTDILRDLYGDIISSGIRSTSITHEAPDIGFGGAEHGGEGGSERKDFKDAVFFDTITADRHGKATAEFQVPDNLTSWRLTCQAVTSDLAAGTKTAKVIVKIPFFVDVVLNDTYLVGDQVVLPLRSFGTGLKANTPVQYEAALKSKNETVTQTLQGKSFNPTLMTLPALTKGEYELTVTGRADTGLTDTLTLNFKAADTLMTQQQTEFFTLGQKISLNKAPESIVSVSFADYQRSQYLNMLLRLKCVSGERVEQKVAPYAAGGLLGKYFPDIVSQDDRAFNLLEYQTPDGGISILPYSDSDLELSAKLAGLYSDFLDTCALADYFSKTAENPAESRERGIIALYGLAALNEPVLTELDIVSQQNNLTVKEKLYIALSYMELGAEKSADKHLQELLKAKGEKVGQMLRINTGQDQDDILESTALAAVAAAGLGLNEQNQLQSYVLDNSTTDILLYPEQLMFLKCALPRLSKKGAGFSYTLDGKKQNITLEPGETFTLLVPPEKMAALRFDGIKGKVGATAVYQTKFDTSLQKSSDGVSIKRSYQQKGKTSGQFASNNLVRISINYEFGPKAPDGPYRIVDFLPAGLKVMEKPYYQGQNDQYLRWPVEVEGQKVTFMIYDKKQPFFYYYARVINPGDFKAEPAVIQHAKTGKVYSVTKSDRMLIK